jgi:hypothetical protein
MNNLLRMGLGAVALAAVAVPASAVSFVNAGDTHIITFNGLTDAYLGGATPLPGLTAELTLELTGIAGNVATFNYSMFNSSGGAVTASRSSIFAFDVTSGVVTSASATGEYDIDVLNDDFPNVGGINRMFEVCFKAGGGGSNCSSGGGGGTSLGGTDAGEFTLTLDSDIASITLEKFGIRWQTLDAPAFNIEGGSGIGLGGGTPPIDAVPEPATWAMLIAGFGLVGASMRRRRGVLAHVQA